jgi:hypothetical protein
MISKPIPPTLRAAHQELVDAYRELHEQNVLATSSGTHNFDRHHVIMEKAKEVRDAFKDRLAEHAVQLNDGRWLMRHQFEALEVLAAHNSIDPRRLFSSLKIVGRRVVEADLRFKELRTLEGLSGVESIRHLNVSYNFGLTSLAGIPLRHLETLEASHCDLTGDLTALTAATKLKVLLVSENSGLKSLDGIPLAHMEGVFASECGLVGDLSALADAERLGFVFVWKNQGLQSLSGISVRALRVLRASQCALSGDHTFLSHASTLISVDLRKNPEVIVDKTQFAPNVWIQI